MEDTDQVSEKRISEKQTSEEQGAQAAEKQVQRISEEPEKRTHKRKKSKKKEKSKRNKGTQTGNRSRIIAVDSAKNGKEEQKKRIEPTEEQIEKMSRRILSFIAFQPRTFRRMLRSSPKVTTHLFGMVLCTKERLGNLQNRISSEVWTIIASFLDMFSLEQFVGTCHIFNQLRNISPYTVYISTDRKSVV